MCSNCDYTIHGAQSHFGWDNSRPPALHAEPGSTILFHCHDSSAGQLGPSSVLQDVVNLDFGKINPVSGPIYLEGAKPGDALKVTIDSFGQPGLTDYRNPSLAGMLGQLGYVQRFGAGIPIARAALANNGNPPAEFIVDPTNVAAIVRFE